jgi:hypothetical protein
MDLRSIVERWYEKPDHTPADEKWNNKDPVGISGCQGNRERAHPAREQKCSPDQRVSVPVAMQAPLDAEDDEDCRTARIDHEKPPDLRGAVAASGTKE